MKKVKAYKIIVLDNNIKLYKDILGHAFVLGYGWPVNYYALLDKVHHYVLLQSGNERMIVTNKQSIFDEHKGMEIDPFEFLKLKRIDCLCQ